VNERAMPLHAALAAVTTRIAERSAVARGAYLRKCAAARAAGPHRTRLSCGNLAHGFAASAGHEKQALAARERPNIGIVTAYNDMLSAHQPFESYPAALKKAAWLAAVLSPSTRVITLPWP